MKFATLLLAASLLAHSASVLSQPLGEFPCARCTVFNPVPAQPL